MGRVAALWRYPVKSLGGEQIDVAACAARGVDGDRRWAVRGRDGKLGSGKTTRRFRRMPGLLMITARTGADGAVTLQFPDGSAGHAGDPATAVRVGEAVGEPVDLVEETDTSHYDAAPLHLLTTSSLAWLRDRRPADRVDVRRFRPNLLIETGSEGRPEDGWVGRRLRIGEVVVGVHRDTERCVMVTMAQPDLPFSPALLGDLAGTSDSRFGVYGRVEQEGAVRIGDHVTLVG